ncbi:MAG: helix-turn-helix transcriptional regulator [Corallococcus sp.]|nr:helix-turn-helix transcriptional regulator [Corallococcus sp.]
MVKIRELRKEKGLTQQELAKKINVSLQTISGYETGYAQPPIDILIKIAQEFHTSTDYLLGLTDDDIRGGFTAFNNLSAGEQELVMLYKEIGLKLGAEAQNGLLTYARYIASNKK